MMISTYHEHNSELAGRNLSRYKTFRAIGIDGTALVQQLFDNLYTAQHDHRLTAHHDTVDGSILLGPFGELEVFIFARDLARCQAFILSVLCISART